MWSLTAWRRRRVLNRARLSAALWQQTLADLPLLHGLNNAERQRLRELTILLLHEKSFEAVGGLVLTESMRLTLAALACLPVLNLDLDYYSGWASVIVYPDCFLVRHEYLDSAGVEHAGQRVLAGEAWERGPLIVSWADVERAHAGSNVVIHECAHKLDMANGPANGFPPLHPGMDRTAWARDFTAAFNDLNEHLASGWGIPLDPYAATSPAEFFAVLSETFFTAPARLDAAYPAVYRHLKAFYRQDPEQRLLAHAV